MSKVELLNGLQVLRDAGFDISKIPFLAAKNRVAHWMSGAKSKYRALLFTMDSKTVTVDKKSGLITIKDVESNSLGVSATVAAASIGAILGVSKAQKFALYLTMCALGLSDHESSVVKTILGNATKWTRDNAFERYRSDLALVGWIEDHPVILAHIRKTFEHVESTLRKQQQDAAATARKSNS